MLSVYQDKKNRETRTSSHAPGSQDDGLFSTYVKKPGFAYYRDLAGKCFSTYALGLRLAWNYHFKSSFSQWALNMTGT